MMYKSYNPLTYRNFISETRKRIDLLSQEIDPLGRVDKAETLFTLLTDAVRSDDNSKLPEDRLDTLGKIFNLMFIAIQEEQRLSSPQEATAEKD